MPENNDSGNEENEEEDDDQDPDQDSNEDLGGDQDEDTDEELDLEEDAGEDLDEDEDGNQGGDDQDSHEDLDENHNQDSGEESDQDSNEDANDGDTAAEESDSEWSWISNTAPEIRARRSYSKPRIETVEEANSDSGSQENEFYKGYGFWDLENIVDWRWMTDDFGEFVPTNNGRWRRDYLVKWKSRQYSRLESWQPDWDLTVKAIEGYWRQFDGERPKNPNRPAR